MARLRNLFQRRRVDNNNDTDAVGKDANRKTWEIPRPGAGGVGKQQQRHEKEKEMMDDHFPTSRSPVKAPKSKQKPATATSLTSFLMLVDIDDDDEANSTTSERTTKTAPCSYDCSFSSSLSSLTLTTIQEEQGEEDKAALLAEFGRRRKRRPMSALPSENTSPEDDDISEEDNIIPRRCPPRRYHSQPSQLGLPLPPPSPKKQLVNKGEDGGDTNVNKAEEEEQLKEEKLSPHRHPPRRCKSQSSPIDGDTKVCKGKEEEGLSPRRCRAPPRRCHSAGQKRSSVSTIEKDLLNNNNNNGKGVDDDDDAKVHAGKVDQQQKKEEQEVLTPHRRKPRRFKYQSALPLAPTSPEKDLLSEGESGGNGDSGINTGREQQQQEVEALTPRRRRPRRCKPQPSGLPLAPTSPNSPKVQAVKEEQQQTEEGEEEAAAAAAVVVVTPHRRRPRRCKSQSRKLALDLPVVSDEKDTPNEEGDDNTKVCVGKEEDQPNKGEGVSPRRRRPRRCRSQPQLELPFVATVVSPKKNLVTNQGEDITNTLNNKVVIVDYDHQIQIDEPGRTSHPLGSKLVFVGDLLCDDPDDKDDDIIEPEFFLDTESDDEDSIAIEAAAAAADTEAGDDDDATETKKNNTSVILDLDFQPEVKEPGHTSHESRSRLMFVGDLLDDSDSDSNDEEDLLID